QIFIAIHIVEQISAHDINGIVTEREGLVKIDARLPKKFLGFLCVFTCPCMLFRHIRLLAQRWPIFIQSPGP
ncbi:hypothetical protein DK853_51075, partial [Klebsiella oxytoca]